MRESFFLIFVGICLVTSFTSVTLIRMILWSQLLPYWLLVVNIFSHAYQYSSFGEMSVMNFVHFLIGFLFVF